MKISMLIESPIVSTRLQLKTLDETTVSHRYLSWLLDDEVTQYLEVRYAPPVSVNALMEFVKKTNADPHNLLLGIFLMESDAHIGNLKLGPVDPHHRRAEIGFLIGDKTNWGQGYAGEAIATLANFAFQKLGLAKLTAGCYEGNVGSAKALIKAGFLQEAKLPSHLVLNGRRVDKLVFGKLAQRGGI